MPDSILNYRVNIGLPCGLEIDGNWHMELELINCIAPVLDDVVFESAGTFSIEFVLIGNRLVSLMYNAILWFDTRLTIEHFCLTIKFIYHISQITLIKKHLPIECMQVGDTLTELREILVPNTEKIEFAFIDQLIDIRNRNL